MTVSGYLNGLIFVSGLFLSATFGSIFIMFPSFAFLLIRKPSWFRLYNDLWGGFWLTFSGVSCSFRTCQLSVAGRDIQQQGGVQAYILATDLTNDFSTNFADNLCSPMIIARYIHFYRNLFLTCFILFLFYWCCYFTGNARYVFIFTFFYISIF